VRLITLAVSLATVLLVSGCAPGGTAEFDRAFIDMMVPHHQGAVEMAKIAQQRAERPEIKELAATIITAQEQEIAQLKQWRQAWFNSDQTPSMNQMPMVPGMSAQHTAHGGASGSMDMAADVETLRKASEPFDRAFIDAMIPHHQSAIDAATAAEKAAQRSEIKELARTVVREQQREIDQLAAWRLAWYGSAPSVSMKLR
jgi:uncharacterized protein (DUF305 family)